MIRLLDKNTIDKIAAGEVIERPFSVVKELLENSIDANSTMITVEIKDGGSSLIRVTDNGCGISEDDVRTAYMRHATSKISTAEDLESIESLGFRGEALSTIAAVSQTEMITKQADSLTGIKYVIHGGEEIEYSQVGVPNGTTVVVRNLFFNTPARKKFLKSAMTEASYINDLVLKIALSHPEISFKLIVNNQTKINTAGNNNIKDTIYQLFGRDITNNLIEIDYESNGISLKGYIGKPFISRGNRGLENYFINNRYIKSNIVNRAIEEGYKTFVMQHKFPFTVLYITLATDKCDVNVHPTKMEFKYDNERELFEVVTKSVREGLTRVELIPKPGVSNKTENPETPAIKTEKPPEPFEAKRNNANIITKNISQYSALKELSKKDSSSSTILDNLLKEDGAVYSPSANNFQKTNVSENKSIDEKNITNDTKIQGNIKEVENKPSDKENGLLNKIINTVNKALSTESQVLNEVKNTDSVNANSSPDSEATTKSDEIVNTKAKSENSVIYDKNGIKKEVQYNTQTSLFNNEFLSEKARSKHRLIGQVFDTYWLIEYENNLYIMDQHAAHEKVKYEELIKNLNEKEIYTQQLLPPIVVTVSYAEKQVILDNYDLFMKIGYDISEFGGNEFKISGVPANLYGIDVKELFLNFVAELMANSGYVSNDIFIKKLSTMACKSAIKGNTRISFAEADRLIDQLLKLENPYTCPHGRPTIITISEVELEKKFKRIV